LWGVVLFTLLELFAVARVLEPCTPFKTEVLVAQVYLELVAIADHISWGHKVEHPPTNASPTPCNWWVHHLHTSQSLKMTKTTKINKHEVYLTGLAQHMDTLGDRPKTEQWVTMHTKQVLHCVLGGVVVLHVLIEHLVLQVHNCVLYGSLSLCYTPVMCLC
jgi:hypothetical protein